MSIYQFLCYALINANTHIHPCAYICKQYLHSGAVPQYFYHAVYVSGLYHTFPHFSRRLSNKYSVPSGCRNSRPLLSALSFSHNFAHPALPSVSTASLAPVVLSTRWDSFDHRSLVRLPYINIHFCLCICLCVCVCLCIGTVSFIRSLAHLFRYFY